MALLFFTITLFVSAFLLFLVQPIIGKMILPKLGGTPQVWNTCMVFFQTALLAGYFYTHTVSTYLRTRTQIILHCVLLFVPLLILLPWGPFNVVSWVPPAGGNPIFATLWLLTIVVGIPFFVVATTAPLLQKWFACTGHPASKDPYFLYGASNLGSMLSLVLYPVLIEPFFGLRSTDEAGHIIFSLGSQSWLWTAGYLVLIALVIGCGVMAFKGAPLVMLAGHGRAGTDVPPAPAPSDVTAPPVPAENFTPAATTTPPAAEGEAAATTNVTANLPAPAPAPKPGPSTAIKKGSKQQKKGKHKHHQKQEPQRRELAQSVTATAPAASSPTAAPAALPSFTRTDELTPGRRFRWVLLAAVPSSLMLAVTTHMSTDISAIPLFWVLPLSLYLLSFILVFMRWPFNWLEQAHFVTVCIQPVLLGALVVTTAVADVGQVMWPIAINLLAFFATALVCHGELAKDRPSTKHLTEYYLWMSVGGMVGGLFNGLIAPVLFPGLWEYPIALFCAGLLRPTLVYAGWIDQFLAGGGGEAPAAHKRGQRHPIRRTGAQPSQGLTVTLDVGLPIALFVLALVLNTFLTQGATNRDDLKFWQGVSYGLPLAIACLFYGRPVRYGLTFGLILLLLAMRERGGGTIIQERSYFGILNVRASWEALGSEERVYYRTLTHGTTQHGENFIKKGNLTYPNKTDLSRLATTYYHRAGPIGMAMERFDWFVKLGEDKWRQSSDYWNTYWSDARMPASIAGVVATPMLGGMGTPVTHGSALVAAWSEPPYATIGLGTGTMASYARPFQTLHFYEIDDRVRRYSLPEDGREPYFTYLLDASITKLNKNGRGAAVDVLMGDARLRMTEPWVPKGEENARPWDISMTKRGGPDGFYYLIVVDAFSSDAIPIHLLTKEAVEMYMTKLAPPRVTVEKDKDGKDVSRYFAGGVLCVHVSNRHLDLVPVVADIANAVKMPKIDTETGKVVRRNRTTGKEGPDEEGEVVMQSLAAKRGRDNSPGGPSERSLHLREHIGHTTSEWVIVARNPKDLEYLSVPADYNDLRAQANQKFRTDDSTPYWTTLPGTGPGRYVWTDDYSNLLAVFRWPWRRNIE